MGTPSLAGKSKSRRAISRWVMSEPGGWCHERMVVPARLRSKRIDHDIERGMDQDACYWPDYKKPHDYY